MEGIVGHLTVGIVDRHIVVGHSHCPGCRLARDFGEDPVTLCEDSHKVATHDIVVAEQIAGTVVKVGHAGVIGDIVDADHGVLGLHDI